MSLPRTSAPPSVAATLTGSRLIRSTLLAVAFVLGTASLIAHGAEYWRDIRYSKDFALDYSSARAFLDGEDPYAEIRRLVQRYLDPPPDVMRENVLPGGNWHPPFKIILTVPFALLPYRAAGIAWLLLSAACFVASAFVLGGVLGWSRRSALAVGFGFLAIPSVQLDLSAGQLNGPMLLLLLLAWRAVLRGRDGGAGVAFGTVVALKGFPVILALPLLGARRFRVVGIAAATAAALSIAGILGVGTERLGNFLHAGGGEEGFGYWDSSPANISWWSLVTRWLTPNGWVRDGLDLGAGGIAIAVVFAAGFLALAIRPPARLSRDPFWAAAPLMVLAWPISWIHYPALALPWIVLAGRETLARAGARLLVGFGLVAFAIMMGFPPGTPPLDEASTLDVATLYVVPTVGLLGAVLLDLFSSRPEEEAASEADPTPAR